MGKNKGGTVFKVPNLLRAKVGNAPGPRLDQIVAEAEKALDDLQEQSRTWIQNYLSELDEALIAARASAEPNIEAIERVRKVAHEVKGQGTTFGYPLLTVVGDMLQRFIERDPEAAARHVQVVAGHVDFMNLVAKNEIHDDGGPVEAQLLSALETATDKILKA